MVSIRSLLTTIENWHFLVIIYILNSVKMAENGSLQQEQRQQWQAEAAKHQEYENNLVSLRKDIVKNHEKIIGIMQDLHGQVSHPEI